MKFNNEHFKYKMKALLVLLLVAVASCNTEIQEPELQDVNGLLKCITEVAPLVPDVIEIINHIKAADWAQVAIKAVDLVSKGIPAVKECIAAFKEQVNLEGVIPDVVGYAQCIKKCSQLRLPGAKERCFASCHL